MIIPKTGGTVNLDDTDTITIYSNASDPVTSSGIQNQTINWWRYDSGDNLIGSGNSEWLWPAAGGLHSTIIAGPLNDGDRIEYVSQATDIGGPNTTYDPASGRYSFTVVAPPSPPTCAISTPASAEIGVAFDIDVSESTDPDGDIDNAQVRFLSDDNQDDNPAGVWTGWFDWDVSGGDWDAAAKKMSWSFAAVGSKEVWMEIKDEDGLTCQAHSDMNAAAGNAAPTALFNAAPN